jgi:hypothetical protein
MCSQVDCLMYKVSLQVISKEQIHNHNNIHVHCTCTVGIFLTKYLRLTTIKNVVNYALNVHFRVATPLWMKVSP